jgi:hypothetical protein
MLEKGMSGLMSGEGKRAAASRPRTAPFLDSTPSRGNSRLRKRSSLKRPTARRLIVTLQLCSCAPFLGLAD